MILDGKKTYIVGSIAIIWSIVGLAFGWLESQAAMNVILAGLGAFGIRSAIKKAEK